MLTRAVAKLMLCGAGIHEGRLHPSPQQVCKLFNNNSLTATKLDTNMLCDRKISRAVCECEHSHSPCKVW